MLPTLLSAFTGYAITKAGDAFLERLRGEPLLVDLRKEVGDWA